MNKIIFLFLFPFVIALEFPEGFHECSLRIDPSTEQFLKEMNKEPPIFRNYPIEELRKLSYKTNNLAPHKGIKDIHNITIEGAKNPLGLRIYVPEQEGILPVLVFIHGGGWILSGVDDYDYFCQELAVRSKAIVVSVNYNLAPENSFPGPVDDCYSAVKWVEQNIKDYRGDPKKVVVGGDSAGGNLTAAVTFKARDNQGPQFIGQLLICPVLNHNFETLSYYEFEKGYFINKEDMMFFWDSYTKDSHFDYNDPLLCPLRASNLANLPPAFFVIANYDVLRDEGLSYSLRLHRDNVPVKVRRYPSIHGFYGFPNIGLSEMAINDISKELINFFSK